MQMFTPRVALAKWTEKKKAKANENESEPIATLCNFWAALPSLHVSLSLFVPVCVRMCVCLIDRAAAAADKYVA